MLRNRLPPARIRLDRVLCCVAYVAHGRADRTSETTGKEEARKADRRAQEEACKQEAAPV